MKSYIAVPVAIAFGVFFIFSIVSDTAEKDDLQILIETVWSFIAIFGGLFGAIKIDWMIKRNIQYFRKAGLESMAKEHSQAYMKPFGRTLCLVFVCIGITLLLQNYTNLF